MPYTEEQENYFKLITLIYCIGANVNRELLQKFINSRKITLEQFINDHQHEIYHFVCNDKCCQCKTKPIPLNDSGVISRSQMQIVFEYPSNDRLENHKKERTGHLCCLKAIKNVELKDLDFTLIKFFLVNFCHQIFWDCLLENVEQTFSEFLEANVHKVYHLSRDGICCCRCNVDRDIPKKRINETQFEIIYEKVRLPCQLFCSCQYGIQSGLTLSLMIQLHKDLTTKLTKYFCSCRKSLENIYNNRNKIAHPPESSINNDTFSDIWNETATNILQIAKALNKQEQYDSQLTKLRDEPTNKDSLITLLLNLRKTSDHETSNTLQNISSKTDSIETKIADLFALYNKQIAKDNTENSKNGCTRSILDRLQDIAIAVCKESTTRNNPEYLREMEVILSVEIRNTRKSSKLGQDEAIEDSTYGQCKTNCTKLDEFCKHQDKKQLKTTNSNSSEKITYKIKAAEEGESWKTKAMEMFQSDPDYFDADSLDTKDDDSIYLKCGRCGQVYHNIDSFVLHKKECIRFRKKRSRYEQGITMLYQRSENTLQTNSITEAASANQKLSLKCTQNSGESQGANFETTTTTTTTKVRVRVKASEQSFSEISEQSTINRTWSLQMFSKEEVNFSKMGMIMLNTLTDVLYDLLKQDKPIFRPRIDCDITYLYIEHRKNNKHTPSNGWGGQWQRIKSTDIAVGDDIERIKLTRNELQYSWLPMLDDKRFAELSNIICELLKRFDIHNKPTRLYTDQLNEILAKTISADDVKAVEDALFGMTIEVEIEH